VKKMVVNVGVLTSGGRKSGVACINYVIVKSLSWLHEEIPHGKLVFLQVITLPITGLTFLAIRRDYKMTNINSVWLIIR
jgi:hypothetical protein